MKPCYASITIRIWQNDGIVKPVRKLEMDTWIYPADQQGESCWY